ncbi:9429_t:CDS:2 [Acaulospora morrowiae]|uniref:9429_t:CDS:1 n=1 Tax=Acaulospora morrowiae TaxID=94023 RepID=A0A9N9C4G1_9GLOM|nr:9429_t:CDS:2 [Acaulospora morrowiae]
MVYERPPPENQHYYFRIKRRKLTIFLTANGNDKISTLKKEIIKILDDNDIRDPTKIKLLKSDNSNPPVYTSLDMEGETVNSYGLSDEQILYLTFWDDSNGKFFSNMKGHILLNNIALEKQSIPNDIR